MQLFVRNRRPTASLSTPLYLSVSAIRESSLGEYLSDIEKDLSVSAIRESSFGEYLSDIEKVATGDRPPRVANKGAVGKNFDAQRPTFKR